MRILFLDIDGVLLPQRMYLAANQTKPIVTVFDPGIVGMLNTLAQDYGWRFVIHSSWLRTSFHGKPSVYEHMIEQGLKREFFHDTHSCLYAFTGTRWLAIADWLDDHEVEDYFILDDESLPWAGYEHFKDKLIQTDFCEGFTWSDFQRLQDYSEEKGYND